MLFWSLVRSIVLKHMDPRGAVAGQLESRVQCVLGVQGRLLTVWPLLSCPHFLDKTTPKWIVEGCRHTVNFRCLGGCGALQPEAISRSNSAFPALNNTAQYALVKLGHRSLSKLTLKGRVKPWAQNPIGFEIRRIISRLVECAPTAPGAKLA